MKSAHLLNLEEIDMIRVIAHLDMDCFYCQVEHVRMNIPRNIPLAVQQWNSAIAVNYAARAFSIKRGMSAKECKTLCPEIQLVHVELITDNSSTEAGSKVSLERYRKASEEVMSVLQRFAPHCERASIDEAYLDLTSLAAERESDGQSELKDLAVEELSTIDSSPLALVGTFNRRLAFAALIVSEIRAKIYEELGYTVSAGIAGNKLLAKQASAARKPNKQTVVPKECVEALMKELKVRDLRGLGGRLGDALVTFSGAQRAVDIQTLSESALCQKFGDKDGKFIHRICRGIDDEPVKLNMTPKSILAFKSFSPEHTREGLERWVKLLCTDLLKRMEVDQQTNHRRPKGLCVFHRGVTSSAGEGGREKRGWVASTVSRSGAMPGFAHGRFPALGELVAAAMALLSRLPQVLPCTRVAVGATDMVDQSTAAVGMKSLASFFGPRPSGVSGVQSLSLPLAGGENDPSESSSSILEWRVTGVTSEGNDNKWELSEGSGRSAEEDKTFPGKGPSVNAPSVKGPSVNGKGPSVNARGEGDFGDDILLHWDHSLESEECSSQGVFEDRVMEEHKRLGTILDTRDIAGDIGGDPLTEQRAAFVDACGDGNGDDDGDGEGGGEGWSCPECGSWLDGCDEIAQQVHTDGHVAERLAAADAEDASALNKARLNGHSTAASSSSSSSQSHNAGTARSRPRGSAGSPEGVAAKRSKKGAGTGQRSTASGLGSKDGQSRSIQSFFTIGR